MQAVRDMEARLQRRVASLKTEYEAQLAIKISAVHKRCRQRYDSRLEQLRRDAKEYAVRCVASARRALVDNRSAGANATAAASATASATARSTRVHVIRQSHAGVQTDGEDSPALAPPQWLEASGITPEMLSPEQTAALLDSILRQSIPLNQAQCVISV